jgi:hypothetical protein
LRASRATRGASRPTRSSKRLLFRGGNTEISNSIVCGIFYPSLELAVRDKFDESGDLRKDLTIEHVLPEAWTTYWPLSDGTHVPHDLMTVTCSL